MTHVRVTGKSVKANRTMKGLRPGPMPTVAKVTVRVPPFDIYTGSIPGPTFGTVTSALGDTSKYTSYQAVYDEYRIVRVRVRFVNQYNNATLSSTVLDTASGRFAACIDWDDAVTPTGYPDILNHQNVETGNWLHAYSFDYVPKALLGANTGSVIAGAPVSKPWLDTAQPAILHYGIKWMIDPDTYGVLVNPIFSVWAEYDLEFRNPT